MLRPLLAALLLVLVLAGAADAQQDVRIGTPGKGTTPPANPTSTSIDANRTGLDVNIVGGGGSGGTASNFGNAIPATGTAAGARDTGGNMQPLQLDGAGVGQNLNVNCKAGCAAAGDTTTPSTPLGAINNTIAVALAGERGVAFQLQSGGTGVYTVTPQCSYDGGTIFNTNGYILDPVSFAMSLTATIASGQATTDYPVLCPGGASHAQMKVTAYTSGTANWLARSTVMGPTDVVYGSDGTNIRPLAITTGGVLKVDLSATAANATAVKVDGSAVTQPVSGTVTTTPPANASTNVTQFAGSNVVTGTGASGAGIPRVTVANDSAVVVSGTVTANAGTNLNTSALALDATVGRAQASTTSGQTGPLVQGAVTTSAPGYATGQTNPLSLQADGSLRTAVSNTVTVTGTVTTTPPSNASTNVAQFAGTNVSTGTGAGGAGIPRVTISNDSSLAANQSVNTAQFGGTNVVTGTGASGSGIPRVTVSNDSTVILGAGAATIGALTANQSVNVAQVNGATTQTGTGTAGTGTQRVAVSSDSFPATQAVTQSGTWTVQPGNTANTTPWLASISQGGNTAAVNASSQLSVNCANCSGSGASATDQAAFAAGTSVFAPAGGEYNPTAAPLASGQQGMVGLTANRAMLINPVDSAGRELGVALPSKQTVPLVTQTAPAFPPRQMLALVPQPALTPVGVQTSLGQLQGGLGTNGRLAPFIRCDQSVAINTAASGFTQLVALIGGQSIYVCGYDYVSTSALSVKFSYGTGAACATGTVDLTGAQAVAANGGVVIPNSSVPKWSIPAGQALCINLSGATQVSGSLSFAQF